MGGGIKIDRFKSAREKFRHGTAAIRSFTDLEISGSVHGDVFYSLKEAQMLIEQWRLEYNMFRLHSSLKYRPPATEAWLH